MPCSLRQLCEAPCQGVEGSHVSHSRGPHRLHSGLGLNVLTIAIKAHSPESRGDCRANGVILGQKKRFLGQRLKEAKQVLGENK